MLKNSTSIVDDRGYNQGFKESPALIKRMQRRADWIINELDKNVNKQILEIGCGTGFLSYQIAFKTGMQVTGSDLCVPFIEEAKKNYILPNLQYQVLDFNKAAEDVHNKFDYIVGNGILHHLYYHLDEVFISFKNILTSKGKIIFMEPNIYNPYVATIFKNKTFRKWAKLEPDEMAFSKKFIQDKLLNAGFVDTRVDYKDFLLPDIPTWLIKPSVVLGDILEKTPFKYVSQSLFISGAI